MNSWMSRLLLAWAPPLMMFIMGTGMTGSRPLADVAEQRQLRGTRAAACALAREMASSALAPRRPLVSVPSRSIIDLVEALLVARIAAEQRLAQHGVDVLDRLEHALAAIALGIPVAQLHRLARSGGGAGGHGGATQAADVEHDIRLHRGIAAGIHDFAAADFSDTCS